MVVSAFTFYAFVEIYLFLVRKTQIYVSLHLFSFEDILGILHIL